MPFSVSFVLTFFVGAQIACSNALVAEMEPGLSMDDECVGNTSCALNALQFHSAVQMGSTQEADHLTQSGDGTGTACDMSSCPYSPTFVWQYNPACRDCDPSTNTICAPNCQNQPSATWSYTPGCAACGRQGLLQVNSSQIAERTSTGTACDMSSCQYSPTFVWPYNPVCADCDELSTSSCAPNCQYQPSYTWSYTPECAACGRQGLLQASSTQIAERTGTGTACDMSSCPFSPTFAWPYNPACRDCDPSTNTICAPNCQNQPSATWSYTPECAACGRQGLLQVNSSQLADFDTGTACDMSSCPYSPSFVWPYNPACRDCDQNANTICAPNCQNQPSYTWPYTPECAAC